MIILFKNDLKQYLDGNMKASLTEISGTYKGYPVKIFDGDSEFPIEISVDIEGGLNIDDLKSFLEQHKHANPKIMGIMTFPKSIKLYVKRPLWKKDYPNLFNNSIIPIVNYLIENGYQPCLLTETQKANAIPKSTLLSGFIGAIIGSLIGVVLWVLIYKIGFIAGIAGAITAICAMKGYQMLGRSLDKKGVIVSVIITVVMIFFANKLSWSWEIYDVFKKELGYDITFFDAFISSDDIITALEVTGDYYKDLMVGYALTILASYRNIINAFKATNAN